MGAAYAESGDDNARNEIANNAITYPELNTTVAYQASNANLYTTPLEVGNDTGSGATSTVGGFVWRIAVRSFPTNTATTGGTAQYEEAAFRTVLTYRISGMGILESTSGQYIQGGDQVWIRGGDGVGTSSVPGFPLNWKDEDFSVLQGNTTTGVAPSRAGIRLLHMVTAPATNMYGGSVWKWVTWETNVVTYFDMFIGRTTGAAASTTLPTGITVAAPGTGTKTYADEAWQYGPRFWANQRGFWTPAKVLYPLVPGKNRWIDITGQTNGYGGPVNFSPVVDNRITTYPVTTNMQPAP
jgi:hypothetical protein